MWEWALTSIDSTRPHSVGFEVSWHGRVMVFAWCLLVPIGIFAARFFKITPRQDWPRRLDNQVWWATHLTAQYTAGFLMVIAVYLIWNVSGTHVQVFYHHLLGWTTISLCGVQYLAGWLRGTKGGPTDLRADGTPHGDHYDMTSRRKLFEYVHKFTGYVCLTAAIAAVFTGLWVANAPHWMWISLTIWWVAVIYLFLKCERIFGAVDTYQAIWGPNPDLPGNKMRPIGLGIKRASAMAIIMI